MTETLVEPENETFPNRTRITRKMCQFLMDNGLLIGRYELIDGVILSKMGQNAPHIYVVDMVSEWLRGIYGYRFVRVEKPLAIPGESGETTEPEPDAAVMPNPTTAYAATIPGPEGVALIVEVSDTTLRLDLRSKAALYSRVGVPEYWVFDVAGRQIHRHRFPTASGYTEIVVLTENESITAPGHAASIRIGDLLPPE